jgi:hypothetical protein
MKLEKLFLPAVLIGVAYYIIKNLPPTHIGEAANKVLQYITSDGPVKVNANIILPGAQAIPASSVTLAFQPGENFASFSYAGMRYQVLPRNSDGDYPAVPL